MGVVSYNPIQPKQTFPPVYTPTVPDLSIKVGQPVVPATTATPKGSSGFDFNNLLDNVFGLGSKFLDFKILQNQPQVYPGTYPVATPTAQTGGLSQYIPIAIIGAILYFTLKD